MPGPRHSDWLARDWRPVRPSHSAGFLLSAFLACLLVAADPAESREASVLADAASNLTELARQGLWRHPSVMLAGLVALAVPIVGSVAALARLVVRIRRRRAIPPPCYAGRSAASGAAWIELPDEGRTAVDVGELVRIGDGDDCELALTGPVARGTCAIIQRTPECEFILFDVSAGGARMAVNGASSGRWRLRDGDRIEIGDAFMVFRTGDRVRAAGSISA